MAKDKKDKFKNKISIKNRKAYHEFELLETWQCGMILKGSEIKSIRQGKVNMQEAYCYFQQGEIFIKGLHISPYECGSLFFNHEAKRIRKLLLKKREIEKLQASKEEKGLTLVPTRLYINDRGFAKLEIALAKGKKLHDKRQSIKEKDTKRELQRMRLE